MDLVAGSQFGAYRILNLIGKGGMGRVYAAEDSRLHRKVALKVLPAEATQQPERVRRFEQEARAVSALNHPNILTIYEVGELEGTHYIATELVDGDTLRHRVGARTPLRKILDIAVQAASALAAAHAAGIVHRDIKPDNIMVRPDGLVKILDFGLAKLTEAAGILDENMATALSEPGRVMGTWMYMSPEQVRGKDVDSRSDIWSLGVVIYELVCGRSPFVAATATDTIVSIVDREPVSPAEFGVEVPEELDRILSRALAKDREQRYQSIKDMWLDLKQLSQEMELGTITRMTRSRSVIARTPAQKPRSKAASYARAMFSAIAVLAVVALGWGAWRTWHRTGAVSAPQRELSYSLLVQKMRDAKPYGDPFLSTGREIFENGWKFRFNFSAPQPGSLYLLNEGPGPGGAVVLTMLFPLASAHGGLAQLAASERVETGWYVFDQHEGTEKFWIVWSTQPVDELELAARAANNQNQGVITDPQQSTRIREILLRYSTPAPAITADSLRYQTTLSNSGETLANAIELEHR